MSTRSVFDMNQCKPGDLLESIHGAKLVYVGKTGNETCYPHQVNYFEPMGAYGSRSDEGWAFKYKPLPGDHDIKGFWQEKPQTYHNKID